MLKRSRWFHLLGEPSLRAHTADRLDGRVALRAPCHQEVKVTLDIPQNLSLITLPCWVVYGWDAHKWCKEKISSSCLCCLVEKAPARVRVVSFLHSLGNERQWWRCVFTDMIKTMVHKKTPSQSMHGEGETYEHLNMMKKGWRVLLHSAMKALLAKNHGKEKTNKYPVWVQRRKEEVTKQT